MDLQHTCEQITDLIKQAGDIVRDYYHKPVDTQFKGTIDLVTEADQATEAFLVEHLMILFPDVEIIGEEGTGYYPDGARYRWYVDPIDGTTNFAHRLPHFSISIGLTTTDDDPLLGVVYHPLLDECFYAYQGGGAYLNGRPMQVSNNESLQASVLATGFPYDRMTSPENNLREFSALMLKIQGGRRLGSAALDLAYVAAGRLDGFWEQKLNPWDAFAGVVLVTEAGGKVTDYEGQPLRMDNSKLRVIASNGNIHHAMQDVIAAARS